ncbi:PAS fold PAC domain containing protein [Profundibacterium mesophilum KAUST100406-0324]|uniref:PAS fold PAC domain containing protein n=2 Tax=Profundibacterium TaxID=1258570 RepID=A0A921TEC8_9RHOB|nr:PAS fold PAC domain containing protein [Profundibacterium mesophilum KAUST100406-0324]
MRIGQLIADLTFTQARLRASFAEEGSARIQAELVREAARVMDAIERYVPDTEAELREQVQFFMIRASRAKRSVTRERDTEIALRLLHRHSPQFRTLAPRQEVAHPRSPAPRNAAPSSDQRMSSYVFHSPERVCAVDRDYRYLATSATNASFNRRSQVGMIGMHVVEIIGLSRFNDRAREMFDRCLGGKVHEYYYDLQHEDGTTRIIRCQMKPVHDEIGTIYCALAYMTDVTEAKIIRL